MADTNNTERKSLEDFEVRKLAAIGAVYAPYGLVERRPIEYRRELENQFVRGYRAAESRQPNAALADGWISVDDRLPEPGKAVLLDIGLKTPIRAMWASKHSVEAGDECPDAWAEYDEGSDTYYCPEGWYEWNQYEETHWAVSRAAVAWMALPAPPTINASKEPQP